MPPIDPHLHSYSNPPSTYVTTTQAAAYYLPAGRPGPAPVPPDHSFDPGLVEGDSGDDSDGHQSPPGDGSASVSGFAGIAVDPKRSRACDSCRGLKVKCDFSDGSNPGEPCKRCAKARRPCIVTPATRRRQKKADTRVAELERKVDALTARLAEQTSPQFAEDSNQKPKRSSPPYQMVAPLQYPPGVTEARQMYSPGKRRKLELSPPDVRGYPPNLGKSEAPSVPSAPSTGLPTGIPSGLYNQGLPKIFDHSDIDHKISMLITSATAESMFNRYIHQFVPQFPAVVFPTGTRADEVRQTRPILYLAILSSTCYGAAVPAETQEALEELFRDALADSMWKKGEKSLEIIQSLQVATLWYRPPHNFEQHMFYQMVHASAIMAIDIGMGKTIPPSRRKHFDKSRKPGGPNPESAEIRRAWLTSYFLCTSISMILRRAIIFRWTPYMQECIEYLENPAMEDVLPSDRILCQQVRLSHVSEEIVIGFALNDPTVTMSISEGKVRSAIKNFEKDLADISSNGVTDYGIKLSEYNTSLYLHEIALHSQHNVEEFKLPFMEETFKGGATPKLLGQQHIDALKAYKTASRNLLDTYLSYKIDVIYILPVVFSVRCINALVALIKLYMAAKAPGEVSKVIDKDELRVKDFIQRLHSTFAEFMTSDPKSPHSKFLHVIDRLRNRFNDIERGDMDPAKAISAVQAAQAAQAIAMQMASQATNIRDSNPPPPTLKNAPHPQGLHLLSEAAMSNNDGGQNTNHGATMAANTTTGPQSQHSWYQGPQVGGSLGTGAMPMDPSAYSAYNVPITGLEHFDYGFGSIGIGMDNAISGLFMADSLWNYEPYAHVLPGGGWQ